MKVYLDHAATTPTDKDVLKEMIPFFTENFGNASSLHKWGQDAKKALEDSRRKIADLINATPEEIVFTAGGSESDNLAIKGILKANKEKNHIITTDIEHHAVHTTAKELEKEGFNITFIKVDEKGIVNPDDVKEAITDKTALVSIMHANNEIGTIQPIEEIGKICKSKNIIFHTDAVQTVGKIPVDVNELNVDLLSASAHKLYGPKGIGFLYVRRGTRISPLIQGGNHESGKRSGTENIPGIVGFGKACELAKERMSEEIKKEIELSNYLIKNILENIEGSHLNGHPIKKLPGTNNFRFDLIEGEALIMLLNEKGIAASTGSACSTKSLTPSHVLTALGLKHEQTHGSLRLSLGKDNTIEEMDYVIECLKEAVKRLRQISPLEAM